MYAVLLHKSYNLAMYFGPNILLLHMLKENSQSDHSSFS
ncbi:hypothetical protein CRJUMX02_870026 [Escherichia coli]|nr:hypothetical protein AD30_2895 [Escherichia coli 2-316-03_S4_C3]KEN36528.1 hypothetical protein AB96_4863 [Escherichia coli 8-415-05_S3_C1]VEW06918.1 hypothetical protein CRJUMX01_550089 [Escherichia coli]VEW06946.1 hypothetical protein CRJUMX02_870026 [Escherichia coli]